MENYIVINGNKTELTEEQLKQLGIKTEKKRNNPFNSKLEHGAEYFTISASEVYAERYNAINSSANNFDEGKISNASSFNDRGFAEQIRLHELLNRKLLKYAWDNEAEDCEWKWDNNKCHYSVFFNYSENTFGVDWNSRCKYQNIVYFSKEKVARQAIKDVIEPFMKEHPEFVW